MRQFLLLIALLFSVATHGYSQSYNFIHYQVENGLSYNSVISSLQDEKGFLWFGTKNGLNRFDGYNFKIFKNDPNHKKSIGNNYIHALCEDKQQNIWVGTLRGLFKYNPLQEDFTLVQQTKNQDIRDVKVDNRGMIWYIGGTTLYQYNAQTKRLQVYDQINHAQVTSITLTKNHQLWLSTTDGYILKYDYLKNSFESYNIFNRSKPAISNWIEKIFDTGKEVLLIGTSNQGVKSFNTKDLTYKDILTVNTNDIAIYARDFIHHERDDYWIATESGIFIYNLKTGKTNHLYKKPFDPYSLSDNSIYTLTKDKEGGIWAGSYFGGVNYYPKEYITFTKFFPQGNAKSISGYAVREICKDNKGNLWIGTEDAGLNKFNPKTGIFEHFSPNGSASSISHSNIHGLVAVGNELWIGTFEQGLDVIDLNTSKVIRRYRAGMAANQLKSNFIESLLLTKAGTLLVGTSKGLYAYNKSTDDFSLLNEVPGNLHYSALMEDSKGAIWAATLKDGLYYFNPRNRTSAYYTKEENNKYSLISNDVNGVFEDSKGQIWVTTEYGLCKLNTATKKFERFNGPDNLSNRVIYQIEEDKNNNLWMSTSSGLLCFDPAKKTVKSFTKSNGLLGDQLNYKSSFQDDQGKMYFGGVNGLIAFTPSGLEENKFKPAVFFTGLQVNNKELQINARTSPLQQSVSFTDNLVLAHDQSTFSIDFAALSYTAPKMIAYKYQMEGLDQAWVYLTTNRKVYFTNLSPGTYTFRVKASNEPGVWSNEEASLTIKIKRPFWANNTALFIYGALFFLTAYWIYRNTIKRTIRKNKEREDLWETKKEKEIYQAKIEFFTNITHEIRTPLTLIHGPLEDIINTSTDHTSISSHLKVMQRNTNRLIELTDQLLDFRKSEIKGFTLNFINIDIGKLISEICDRYESVKLSKKLLLELQLPEQPLYAYADLEALHKIVSNLLDNAFKYASSRIVIALMSDEASFSILVSSDGHLIPSHLYEKIFKPFFRIKNENDQKGTGIGLALARSLAELHDGQLFLKQEEKTIYNTFVLKLPMHHEREFNIANHAIEPLRPEDLGYQYNPALPSILIVEDNVEIRKFIKDQIFSKFNIVEANNGREALDILKNKKINLLVSDIMMPVMDGLELCKTMKSNTELAPIPVILLTANNAFQTKIEGLEVGADAYIVKPFSPIHLLTQIENLLYSRDLMKNYFGHSPFAHINTMASNKADDAFLEKLEEYLIKNIANKPNVNELADLMNMSRPTFYRKIKAISNLSPHELINITKLKKAAQLIVDGEYTIQQIAVMTGFGSQAYFAKSFHKQFGMPPSAYIPSAPMRL